MKKRTASILKWLGLAIIVLGVVYASLLWHATATVNKASMALEADGRPLKMAEVVPAKIPDSQNAALIYDAAVQLLKAEQAEEAEAENLLAELSDLANRIVGNEQDASAEEQFKALIQRETVQDAIELLRRGALRDGYWRDIDWSEGPAIELPHLSTLTQLSKILAAKARVEAAQRKWDAAWDDVTTALRMANNALRDEPLIVSQLVREAQFQFAVETIRFLAESGPPDAEQYNEIQALLPNFESVDPLVLALDGERVLFGGWVFNRPAPEVFEGLEEEVGYPRLLIHLLSPILKITYKHDHAAYLTLMHENARLASAPYAARDADFAEQMLKKIPWYCPVSRIILPALVPAKAKYLSMIAQARITRAGLATLQYAEKNGSYPENLQALGAIDLVDPYTGEPLIYRTSESGFIVYSVGMSQRDDGGTSSEDGYKKGDIVWEYRRSEKAE